MVSISSLFETLPQAIAGHLHGTVDALTPLPWASSHQSFSAIWHQADGPTSILIKVYEGARGVDALRNEANALRDLSRASFPVPMLYLAVDNSSVIGAPFLVMERLDGEALGSVALKDTARIPYWLDQACGLLRRLHGVQWTDSFDWFQPPLDDFAERHMRWWSRQAVRVQAEDAAPGFAWLNANLYRAKRVKRRALVHRDFHPNNIIANPNRIIGVIDWGELTIADPAVDVGWSRMVLATEVDSTLGDSFADSYIRRDPDIVESLAFWEVFAACKRLTSLSTLSEHQPPVKEGLREAVRSFMESRLAHEE